jgi:hypothetical protein
VQAIDRVAVPLAEVLRDCGDALVDTLGEDVLLRGEAGSLPDVAAVSSAQVVPGGKLALISRTPAGGPSSTTTADLVNTLRDQAGALRSRTGVNVLVTGETATNIDVSQSMADSLIPYLAVVAGLPRAVDDRLPLRLVPLTAIGGFLSRSSAQLPPELARGRDR